MARLRLPWSRSPSGPLSRGFTAAATLIDLSDEETSRREAARHRRSPRSWQIEGWRYHDDLPEVYSATRWMSDVQSRMRVYPAILDPQNMDAPPTPVTKAQGLNPRDVQLSIDITERIRSDEDNRQELQRVIGANLFIAGEVWMVGTDEEPRYSTKSNPTGERWRACSVEELVVTTGGRWAISPEEGAQESELEFLDPETTTLVRCYRRHGRRRSWPISAMRSANIICEELLVATQSILGALRSRIPAGILPIPDTLEDEPDDDDEQADQDSDTPPVLRKLLKHLSTPLRDPKSAAALVPYLLEVPPELVDKIKPIDIARSIDPETVNRIEQLVKRLSIVLDMPPESLTGKGDLNHWNIYELDRDGVRTYAEPYTGLYAYAWAHHILQPRMALAGVADPELWVYHWDPSDVIASPDMSDAAMKGYEAIPPVVGPKAAAQALGFSEDEMPNDEELAAIMEARKATTANTAPPPGTPGAPPGEPPAPGEEGGPPAPGAQDETTKKPPVQASAAGRPREPIGLRWARIESRLQRDLLIAADAALARMLEKAQARIRTAAQRAPITGDAAERGQATRALARALPVGELAPALGSDEVERLGLSNDDLFAGGAGGVGAMLVAQARKARAQAARELRRENAGPDPAAVGLWDERSAEHVEEGAALLISLLAGLAAGRLYGDKPETPTLGELDTAIAVPPSLIKEALTEAGGGALEESGAGGLLAGVDFAAFLDALPEFTRTGFVWSAGAPDRPFDPHQALDGLELSGWDDPALAWDPGDFPFVSVLSPNDHDGCQCVAVPTGDVEVPSPEEA